MHSAPRSETGGSAPWIGLAAAVATLAVLVVYRTTHVVDDAFVVFRHAQNWVQAGVPTWNVGEAPVEGTSSFLWLVLMRWTEMLGLPLEGTSQWLGGLFGVLTLRTLHRHLLNDLNLSTTPAGVGAVALAATPAFVIWCSGGLETSLFTYLLLRTWIELVRPVGLAEWRRGGIAGLGAVGIALCRPEGFLWVLALAASARLVRSKQHSHDDTPRRRTRSVLYFGAYLVGFGAFLYWRHEVFGQWVANPVRARFDLSGTALWLGTKQVVNWALMSVLPIATLLLLPLLLRGPRRGHALGALGMVLCGAVFQILAGPDDLAFFRLMAPVSPFVAMLLAMELTHSPMGRAWTPGTLLVSLAVLPIFHVEILPRTWRETLAFRGAASIYDDEWGRFKAERDRVEARLIVGEALAEALAHGGAVLDPIGAAGFGYPGPVYDRHGHVDAEVARREATPEARAKGHVREVPRAYFLDRSPTILAARLVPAQDADPASAAFREHARSVLDDDPAGEAPLLTNCVVEVFTADDLKRLAPGTELLVWRRVDDPERARAFWAE